MSIKWKKVNSENIQYNHYMELFEKSAVNLIYIRCWIHAFRDIFICKLRHYSVGNSIRIKLWIKLIATSVLAAVYTKSILSQRSKLYNIISLESTYKIVCVWFYGCNDEGKNKSQNWEETRTTKTTKNN